jgi:agmatinase
MKPWWDDGGLDEDGAGGSFAKVAMSDRALRFERTAFGTVRLRDGRLAPQPRLLGVEALHVLPVASSPKAHARLVPIPRRRSTMYEPWNALEAPRFTGPRTYARLPWVKELDRVDAAVYGLPWDGGTSFRPGARFGPEAIRSASGMIRTYNPVQRVQVFGALSTIDFGDAPTAPGYIEESLKRMERFVAPIAEAGVIGIGMGGDHSVALAELRALAEVHGRLGLVQLDAHTDLHDAYYDLPYSHGTMFRRAIMEDVLDPARVIQAGMRGSLYAAEDEDIPCDLGVETIPWIELALLGPEEFAARARQRIGSGPAFLTFDVDFVDPAYCPGTGTPEVAGPTGFEAMQYLRALAGIDFVGYDVVEVAPQYDSPGQITALFAANAIFEMLSMIAKRRQSEAEETAAAGAPIPTS